MRPAKQRRLRRASVGAICTVAGMAHEHVAVVYNQKLKPLEELLSGVKRAGDFVVHGTLELPMPKVEVEGVGVLSFPVPEAQVAAVIKQAVRAPFGRGEETVLDTSVRKVWQVPSGAVRIGGKSWAANFAAIMAKVTTGLGCDPATVSADLYKLLVYDPGGFFRAHRDTEKSGGMFGTLVVVLPAAHRGGELVVRHAGREIVADLSGGDVSEVAFAAFYADCEHEVRPIVEGNRVCLVFNLVQARGTQGGGGALLAPDYESQIAQAAGLLENAVGVGCETAKIAWLLEHHYSPTGLSFAALKSSDAAKAQVLLAAATRANCAAHLGIVHIEETGAAEPSYDPYESRGRRRYRDYDDEEDEDEEEDADGEEDAGSDEFEVVEVSDSWQFIAEWVGADGRPVAFGAMPVVGGELLPQDALDEEKPDEQRLMEATGNEGASFERSYHRAVIVIWHRERYAEVLLQAGVGAALPYLKECIEAGAGGREVAAARGETITLARRMIGAWGGVPPFLGAAQGSKPADRAEMLKLLTELGDTASLEDFVGGVVTDDYDGTENAALVAAAHWLPAAKIGALFSDLMRRRMRHGHSHCVELLHGLTYDEVLAARTGVAGALREVAVVVVAGLDAIRAPATAPTTGRWPATDQCADEDDKFSELDDFDDGRSRGAHTAVLNATLVVRLLDALGKLGASELRETAARKMAARPVVFDPGTMVIPALATVRVTPPEGGRGDGAVRPLWTRSADFLLNRSEFPPEAPKDWRQDAVVKCRCEDCRVLQAFAVDPLAQVHRFRVRKDRRQHLHRAIEQHGLEMTHVTDRKGSPQTLVCTKDRRGYRRRCEQYRQDVAALAALANLAEPVEPAGDVFAECADWLQRIAAARARAGEWSPA